MRHHVSVRWKFVMTAPSPATSGATFMLVKDLPWEPYHDTVWPRGAYVHLPDGNSLVVWENSGVYKPELRGRYGWSALMGRMRSIDDFMNRKTIACNRLPFSDALEFQCILNHYLGG